MATTLTQEQQDILAAIYAYSASDGDISNGTAPTEGQLADVAKRVLGGTGAIDSPMIGHYQDAIALKADFTDPTADPVAMWTELQALIDGENADLSDLFNGETTFNEDYVRNWNVSDVSDMQRMFRQAEAFDRDIGGWNVGNVESMRAMFAFAKVFNQDISGWDVSTVGDMGYMFREAVAFNQDIGGWDVSNVGDMGFMFWKAYAFDQDISGWDVSKVEYLYATFAHAKAFNQDIGGWKVGKVTDMHQMFAHASAFNQDIGGWDVSKVESMWEMFTNATAFNQDIGGWDVSKVETMTAMFYGPKTQDSAFNQDIGGWDVSNVKTMNLMFYRAKAFNQDIGDWDISSLQVTTQTINGVDRDVSAGGMLSNSGMSVENFDKLLAGWSVLDGTQGETQIHSGVTLGARGLTYTDLTSYNRLENTYDWNFGPNYPTLSGTVTPGENGADTLGDDSEDTQQIIHALDGDDTLTGGGGDDILVGGKGDDTLRGNTGADRFVYKYDDDGDDLILDFDIDEDILDLTQLLIGITDQDHDLSDYITVSKSEDDTVLLTIDHDGQDGGDPVTITFNDLPYGSIDPATFLDRLKINYNVPTEITLDNATVDEDITDGGDLAATSVNNAVLVGNLATVDADTSDTFTYSIEDVPNTDGDLFTLLEGQSTAQLHFKGSADHETRDSYQVAIRVIDQYDNSRVEMLTIEVTDYIGRYDGNKAANTVAGSSENDVMRGRQNKDKLDGADGADILRGGKGWDTLWGGDGDDLLRGSKGNDKLVGGDGADILIGGKGADRLFGGGRRTDDDAADIFRFNTVNQIGMQAGSRDIIDFFGQSDGDQIDLSGIDAKSGRAGDQAFRFIEDDPFSGKKGQLRYQELTTGETLVMGDTDGDGRADFRLQINGVSQELTEADFIL